MTSMAELVANKFAKTIDPRNVTPTQNMILDAIKHEAIRQAGREFKQARARREVKK